MSVRAKASQFIGGNRSILAVHIQFLKRIKLGQISPRLCGHATPLN